MIPRLLLAALVLGLAGCAGSRPTASPAGASPAAPLKPHISLGATTYNVHEGADGVVIETPRYRVEAPREGFGLTVRRGGEVVLKTAQPSDADAMLGFSANGAPQHLTRLAAVERGPEGVTLVYETTYTGTTARVALLPGAREVRVTARLLHTDGDLTPWLRVRLAPSGYWYGGGYQGWRDAHVLPLNDARIRRDRGFLSQSMTQATPVWYATRGVGLWLDTREDFPYYVNTEAPGMMSLQVPESATLRFWLLVGDNLTDVARRVIHDIGLPTRTPPEEMFRSIIYTTWVEHKVPVSQEKVLAFARDIRANDLPAGVIELDDRWEAHYGDMDFDAAKFPDPKAMVDALHAQGFRVTLWVHPFVQTDSRTYAEHRTDGILLRDGSGEAGLIKWWNGDAAVWDFTNPAAALEFRTRLQNLQQRYGFDGFKFDGGDRHLVPRDPDGFVPITTAEYADVYNREAAAHFDWNETRVGVYSQPLGVVQRLMDKQTVWGPENGLGAIVPEALVVSLRGFPYLMPDMVGGNQYDNDRATTELMVRWAQASALMPFLQFSVGPWHFGDETVRISREVSRLHERFAPYLYRLAVEARTTGDPILLPLWFHFPTDPETHAITDQYMVGPDVVVAPVLRQGATSRDVYLPAGQWVAWKTGQVIEGGRWLRGYAAPLDVLPLFARAGSEAARLLTAE